MIETIAEAISTSVRPLVTIMLVATLCIIAGRSNIILSSTELTTVVTMVLGFYFGVKSGEATARALSTNTNRRRSDANPESVVNNNSNTAGNSGSSGASGLPK